MSENNLCNKCGSIMSNKALNRSDGGEAFIFICTNCGYNYELGTRLNKIINQFVKYLRVL